MSSRCSTCGRMLTSAGICTGCTTNPAVIEHQQLLAQGLKRCNKCKLILPVGEFHIRTDRKGGLRPKCKSCDFKTHKDWVETHPEHVAEYVAMYAPIRHTRYKGRYANLEYRAELLARNKEWRRTHWETFLEHSRQWARKHPAQMKVNNHRRYARKANLPDAFTANDWNRAVAYWNGCCAYCGHQQGLFHYTVLSGDHFIPLTNLNSPGTVPENMLPACLSCNSSKKGTDVLTWLVKKFGKKHAQATLRRIEAYFAQLPLTST